MSIDNTKLHQCDCPSCRDPWRPPYWGPGPGRPPYWGPGRPPYRRPPYRRPGRPPYGPIRSPYGCKPYC